MIVYRIADGRRPIFDGMGALLHGGRWNSPGRAVVYAAETYASAMLEVLVHANLSAIPRRQVSVEIEIPDDLRVETVEVAELPGWPEVGEAECRRVGDVWLDERRSAVLRVPSVVTAGHERNVLLNVAHPEFGRITVSGAVAVRWGARLFSPMR